MSLKGKVRKQALKVQENEITEYFVYSKLADLTSDTKNKRTLQKIAKEEKNHYDFWKKFTEEEVYPHKLKILFFLLIAKLFGFTFSVKLMEKGERISQVNYDKIAKDISQARRIKEEEERHENQILGFLDEERLKYVGSMVLGLNDALVELTGALAGLTLALRNTKLIAMTGLITGIAASLSMGASEYLSTKAEAHGKNPLKASIYTGIMYIIAVVILILPYYLISNVYLALTLTLAFAITIILLFTFYISVAQDLSFKKRFLEMTLISLGVSVLTFGIGYLVRKFLGIEV